MDPYSLINAGITALAADSVIQALSQAWYGKDMEIYIDPDAKHPPDQDRCPTIQAHSPSKSADEESRLVTYAYWLMITVDDAADKDRVRPADDVNEFEATGRLIALIEQAIAVIRAAKPDSNFVMKYEYETDTVSFFPVHVADVAITFTERKLGGQDPFE